MMCPVRKQSPDHLQIIAADEGIDRPTTLLWAVVQRWHSGFVESCWDVQVVWARGLKRRTGSEATLMLFRKHSEARIAVDVELTDEAAERAAMTALAELQLLELSEQSARFYADCSDSLDSELQRPKPDL